MGRGMLSRAFRFLHKHTSQIHGLWACRPGSKSSCVASFRGLHFLFYEIKIIILTSLGYMRIKHFIHIYVQTRAYV